MREREIEVDFGRILIKLNLEIYDFNIQKEKENRFFGSVKEPKESLCPRVCLSVQHKVVQRSQSSS